MKTVTFQKYSEVVNPERLQGAIENNEMEGFREDFHILHCLIQIYHPEVFLEIGTNLGRGVNIIANAGAAHNMKVISMDLPPLQSDLSKQYPGAGKVGELATATYLQIFADSMTFNYSALTPKPDGWFIDGEHDYDHPHHETKQAIESKARLIVWHDADMPQVFQAIMDAFQNDTDYYLYRVIDTRMMYAVRKIDLQ